ncbi:MAG: hypothetical protein GF419_03130 [Ignavibacteriales bacterium]|nr:hypothetical protein [Ignavibacteriales bacterium]
MSKPKLHLICNAHLDPVWQWRWEEGAAEALSTFRANVDILEENDEFIFNHNEAVLYRWVKRLDPGLYRAIKEFVAEGRWVISGGWHLQPDVNVPGVESLIRHIYEGRAFFQDEFGVKPRVAYNFDSFGHTAGLPQLLRKAGYEMYVHMRPQAPDLDLPSDLYTWRGADGSEILAHRIAIGLYHTEYDNLASRIDEGAALATKLGRDVAVFWGIGDHGGGGTREDLALVKELRASEERVEIVHGSTENFYEAVKDEQTEVVEGDIQRVFTGCYTSLSRVKRGAGRSLALAVRAEALHAARRAAFGGEYPEKELGELWRDHLFNDFHDILPGTCVEPAERDALALFGKVDEEARRLTLDAAAGFNRHPAKTFYLPATILNANTGAKRVPMEIEFMSGYRPLWTGEWHMRLYDAAGNEIECQEEQPEALLPFHDWRRKVSFVAELPGVGSAHYRLEPKEGKDNRAARKPASDFGIDETSGKLESLKTRDGAELLADGAPKLLALADDADSWGTDRWAFRDVLDEFATESVSTVREGAVRTVHERVATYGKSEAVIHTIGYADFPFVELRIRVNWAERQKRLVLSIPTTLAFESVLADAPGGLIARPADGDLYPIGKWALASGELAGKRVGLGVVHNGQHGLDAKDGEIRLHVLRSMAYCHEQGFKIEERPARKFADQGVHDVRVLLFPGDPDELKRELGAWSDWTIEPPAAFTHLPYGSHGAKPEPRFGETPTRKEILDVVPANARMTALKRSRDGMATIVRLQESAGEPTNATIKLFAERDVVIETKLEPLEIKTIRIERDGAYREVAMIEET